MAFQLELNEKGSETFKPQAQENIVTVTTRPVDFEKSVETIGKNRIDLTPAVQKKYDLRFRGYMTCAEFNRLQELFNNDANDKEAIKTLFTASINQGVKGAEG